MGAKFDNNGGGQYNWFDVDIEAETDLGPFISLTIEGSDGRTVVEAVVDSEEEIQEFFSLVERAKVRYQELRNG